MSHLLVATLFAEALAWDEPNVLDKLPAPSLSHDGASLFGLQGAYIHQMLRIVLTSAVRCRSRV